ncbi:TPA: DUF4145 domain-containing protein [Pseudomonas aeruginosa]|nr:DUF4145 domain-containing protein [Pseudomonas aeruginosa]HDZ6692596.1 DUF4145 domain-containing protein [Pseudomonas aeruginosa]
MRWGRTFNHHQHLIPFYLCACLNCETVSLWSEEQGIMIMPSMISAPLPNPDLPDECRVDFEEARQILGASPRGAAALLRLCIQKLCGALGESGRSINDDIQSLVAKGLPVEVQQAFDFIRVTGNNAVHPGEMSLHDSPETVTVMFEMINAIVEDRLSRPKRFQEHYGRLPEGARAAIEKRDTPK